MSLRRFEWRRAKKLLYGVEIGQRGKPEMLVGIYLFIYFLQMFDSFLFHDTCLLPDPLPDEPQSWGFMHVLHLGCVQN